MPRISFTILLFIVVFPTVAKNIEEYKLSLQHQTELNNSIRLDIRTLRNKESRAIKKLREIETKIGLNLKQINKLDKDIAGLKKQEAALQQELSKVKQSLNKEQNQVINQVQYFYLASQQNIAKTIFSSIDKTHTNKISAWYKYLLNQRIISLDNLQKMINKKVQLKSKIEANKTLLVNEILKRKQAHSSLQEFERTNHNLLISIRKNLKNELKMLKQGENEYRNLKQIIDKLNGTVRKLKIITQGVISFAKLKGKLKLPSPFQYVRSGKSLIFKANENSEVTAIASGRVIFSEWIQGYGLLTVIDHGGGYLSLYGRNKVLFKDKGEWVQAGEVISKVGNTGGIVGSGLFFEIRKNNIPINTSRWFSKS